MPPADAYTPTEAAVGGAEGVVESGASAAAPPSLDTIRYHAEAPARASEAAQRSVPGTISLRARGINDAPRARPMELVAYVARVRVRVRVS